MLLLLLQDKAESSAGRVTTSRDPVYASDQRVRQVRPDRYLHRRSARLLSELICASSRETFTAASVKLNFLHALACSVTSTSFGPLRYSTYFGAYLWLTRHYFELQTLQPPHPRCPKQHSCFLLVVPTTSRSGGERAG